MNLRAPPRKPKADPFGPDVAMGRYNPTFVATGIYEGPVVDVV